VVAKRRLVYVLPQRPQRLAPRREPPVRYPPHSRQWSAEPSAQGRGWRLVGGAGGAGAQHNVRIAEIRQRAGVR